MVGYNTHWKAKVIAKPIETKPDHTKVGGKRTCKYEIREDVSQPWVITGWHITKYMSVDVSHLFFIK